MSPTFLELLKHGPVLVADGATGTGLQAAGLPAGTLPEEWNLSRPEVIAALHRAYLDAGARIVLTNTFGGNRIKLARAGRAELAGDTNRRAAEIAVQVAGPYGALVGGDIGPSGELLEPIGNLTYDEAVSAFAEQVRSLEEGGVDCIWIETISDLSEARAAIQGTQQVSSLPIVCTFSFDSHGHTMMGVKPRQAAEALASLGLAAIGSNCGANLDDTLQAVKAMAAVLPGMPLVAKPNAGLPRLVGNDSVYDTAPEEMARYAALYVREGARIVGGCCGSTPAHITAIAQKVRE